MQVLCFWTNCALGQLVKRTQVWWSKSKTEIRLQLVVFLTDKALHPMTYIVQVILFVLLFFSGIITLMVMVGNLCALLFTSGYSSFGMYAVVSDCSKLN